MEQFFDTICHGCNRYSVLCDMDPQPCENCDCPAIDEFPPDYFPWFHEYEEIGK